MQEQRKNVEDPSRKPETLGEAVVLDAMKIAGGDPLSRKDRLTWFRVHNTYSPSITCQIIDSRFAPLIEAAEAVIERWDTPNWMDGGVFESRIDTLRAAIATAKGGK